MNLESLAEDLEKEKATEDFFGGVQARESPSKHHVPVVDEDGFVDRREGLEDWPELWQADKETLADYEIPGSEDFSVQHSKNPVQYNTNDQKPILQPKSQKNKVRLQDPCFQIPTPRLLPLSLLRPLSLSSPQSDLLDH